MVPGEDERPDKEVITMALLVPAHYHRRRQRSRHAYRRPPNRRH